jgi:hypothetical protein
MDIKLLPVVNSLWRHKNGNLYKVAAVTNTSAVKEGYPITVVYFNVDNDTWWSRPATDWHRSMTLVDQ